MSSLSGGQLDAASVFKATMGMVDIDEKFVDQAQKLALAAAAEHAENSETAQADLVNTGDKAVVLDKKTKEMPKYAPKVSKSRAPGAPKAVDNATKEAKEFKQSHPELSSKALIDLYDEIVNDKSSSPEDILKKVALLFPKKSQASDALAFLLIALPASHPLRGKVVEAKAKFDADHKDEIEKGQATTLVARDLAAKGHGKAKHLDAFLTDIVAGETDIVNVCAMLSKKSSEGDKDYSEADLENLLRDVLKSANSILHDGKIESAHLRALCSQIQTLQAGIGIFTTFKKAMPTVDSSFKLAEIEKPAWVNEKLMFKSFLSLVSERVYSSAKAHDIVNRMIAGL